MCRRALLWANTSFLKLLFNLFSFGCAASWLLPGLFSSRGEQGLSFVAVQGLLIAVASLLVGHRL